MFLKLIIKPYASNEDSKFTVIFGFFEIFHFHPKQNRLHIQYLGNYCLSAKIKTSIYYGKVFTCICVSIFLLSFKMLSILPKFAISFVSAIILGTNDERNMIYFSIFSQCTSSGICNNLQRFCMTYNWKWIIHNYLF